MPAPDEPPPPVAFLYATAPDAGTAASLARALVEERLIACGNVLPGVRSVYRWEGAVTEDAEAVLICKTTAANADAAAARLAELSPLRRAGRDPVRRGRRLAGVPGVGGGRGGVTVRGHRRPRLCGPPG